MQTCSFIIKDQNGLHARPCTVLASATRNFESSVTMEHNGTDYDVSNPISLLSASVLKNDEIILKISGNDETEAMNKFKEIITRELC